MGALLKLYDSAIDIRNHHRGRLKSLVEKEVNTTFSDSSFKRGLAQARREIRLRKRRSRPKTA
jgi:hypothetical protein